MEKKYLMRPFVVLSILENEQAYTEINFFEQLLKILAVKFKKIIFLDLLSIDGNTRSEENFKKQMQSKIQNLIELKTNKKLDPKIRLIVICIWDSQKRKSNFEKNFSVINTIDIVNQNHKLILNAGIEMGLFRYLFSNCQAIKKSLELAKLMNYKKIDTFKKRSNRLLFTRLMKKANLDLNSTNFIGNLITRLEINNEKNLLWMLTFIQDLNNKNIQS